MALPTKSTKSKYCVENIRLLILGLPKIGKTSTLAGFPDLLLVATEKRYSGHDFKVVVVSSWKKEESTKDTKLKPYIDADGVYHCSFEEIVDDIVKGEHDFKYIGIDTMDMLCDFCIKYVCKHFGVKQLLDVGFGKAHDMLKSELSSQLDRLFVSKYGLLFTSHTKDKEIIKPNTPSITKTISTLNNQAREVFLPKVTAIGLMKAVTKKIGQTYVPMRVISFLPSEIEEVGDGDKIFPPEIITSSIPSETFAVIKKCFDDKYKKEVVANEPTLTKTDI